MKSQNNTMNPKTTTCHFKLELIETVKMELKKCSINYSAEMLSNYTCEEILGCRQKIIRAKKGTGSIKTLTNILKSLKNEANI